MRKTLIDQFCKLLLAVATLSFIINVSVLIYGIFSRYFIGHSPIWMDELSRYLVIGMVLLVIAPAWLHNKHMRVDFIDAMLPTPALNLLKFYIWILTVAISGYIAWYSYQYALSVSRFTTIGLGISKTIPIMALPVGFACLFFVALLSGPNLKRNTTTTASR
ncbi:TRAP transporter small permease [Gammaproteobacteria bacterium AS21]